VKVDVAGARQLGSTDPTRPQIVRARDLFDKYPASDGKGGRSAILIL